MLAALLMDAVGLGSEAAGLCCVLGSGASLMNILCLGNEATHLRLVGGGGGL